MSKATSFSTIKGEGPNYISLIVGLGTLIAMGLGAAYYMESNGHHVTGMNNQIVWGIPHVFAIFLIVAASGALNVASIASVFGRTEYKPLARMSGLLALTLLAGGLTVLLLDLGRPDRLIIAMTMYNFKSIFAWNIILYSGFFVIVGLYLWTMMQRSLVKYTKMAGLAAFIWRLILTTGTGSIFGFLVARQGYDATIMAPMFIIMSFSFGLAVFLLVVMTTCNGTGRELGDETLYRLKNLLGVFVAAVMYFVTVKHLGNLYAPEHAGVEQFILFNGGIITTLFWGGQILVGGILPLILLYGSGTGKSRPAIATAAALVILGGFAQIYVIIIGGQAYPLEIFPGYDVTGGAFFDGKVGEYSPTLAEFLLGFGGVGVTFMLTAVALKFLPFFPDSLAGGEESSD